MWIRIIAKPPLLAEKLKLNDVTTKYEDLLAKFEQAAELNNRDLIIETKLNLDEFKVELFTDIETKLQCV